MDQKELTITELALMAGVSTRTLRYYDQINLLKPERYSTAGYRLYGEEQINRLQHILFLRELDMGLKEIARHINNEAYSRLDSLREHCRLLKARQRRVEKIVGVMERTILKEERREVMESHEKFEGFKEGLIRENEEKYGQEARQLFGDKAVNWSTDKFRGLKKEEYARFEQLSEDQLESLYAALKEGDPASAQAQHSAALHRKIVEFWWERYTPEGHAGLVNMYLEDERFRDYYDRRALGAAQFLHDAVLVYLEKEFAFRP